MVYSVLIVLTSGVGQGRTQEGADGAEASRNAEHFRGSSLVLCIIDQSPSEHHVVAVQTDHILCKEVSLAVNK